MHGAASRAAAAVATAAEEKELVVPLSRSTPSTSADGGGDAPPEADIGMQPPPATDTRQSGRGAGSRSRSSLPEAPVDALREQAKNEAAAKAEKKPWLGDRRTASADALIIESVLRSAGTSKRFFQAVQGLALFQAVVERLRADAPETLVKYAKSLQQRVFDRRRYILVCVKDPETGVSRADVNYAKKKEKDPNTGISIYQAVYAKSREKDPTTGLSKYDERREARLVFGSEPELIVFKEIARATGCNFERLSEEQVTKCALVCRNGLNAARETLIDRGTKESRAVCEVIQLSMASNSKTEGTNNAVGTYGKRPKTLDLNIELKNLRPFCVEFFRADRGKIAHQVEAACHALVHKQKEITSLTTREGAGGPSYDCPGIPYTTQITLFTKEEVSVFDKQAFIDAFNEATQEHEWEFAGARVRADFARNDGKTWLTLFKNKLLDKRVTQGMIEELRSIYQDGDRRGRRYDVVVEVLRDRFGIEQSDPSTRSPATTPMTRSPATTTPMTTAAVSEREPSTPSTQVVSDTSKEDDVASDATGHASEGEVDFDGGDENDGALAADHRGSKRKITEEESAFAAQFMQASTPTKKPKINKPKIKMRPITDYY